MVYHASVGKYLGTLSLALTCLRPCLAVPISSPEVLIEIVAQDVPAVSENGLAVPKAPVAGSVAGPITVDAAPIVAAETTLTTLPTAPLLDIAAPSPSEALPNPLAPAPAANLKPTDVFILPAAPAPTPNLPQALRPFHPMQLSSCSDMLAPVPGPNRLRAECCSRVRTLNTYAAGELIAAIDAGYLGRQNRGETRCKTMVDVLKACGRTLPDYSVCAS